MADLFSPLFIGNLKLKNRIFVSPMCQYSSVEGMPNDWHLVHLGSRATGGAALVIAEATAVSPEGRISPGDLGIWSDKHAEAFKRITDFIKSQGAVPGIQIAHAGRKASTKIPWLGSGALTDEEGAWETLAPKKLAFADNYPGPKEMSLKDMEDVIRQFKEAALRSLQAGFQIIEIHMAHGYLLHEFLSPLTNKRNDEYGGSLEARINFPLKIARTVREALPGGFPLLVRISATDWMEGGWDLPQSIYLSRRLKEEGVDMIDCSSGGLVPDAKIPAGPGYQIPFAEAIKSEAGIMTAGVGLITKPEQADLIIKSGKADAVLLAREFLRDPYWPLHAASALGVDVRWPEQYKRAKV